MTPRRYPGPWKVALSKALPNWTWGMEVVSGRRRIHGRKIRGPYAKWMDRMCTVDLKSGQWVVWDSELFRGGLLMSNVVEGRAGAWGAGVVAKRIRTVARGER